MCIVDATDLPLLNERLHRPDSRVENETRRPMLSTWIRIQTATNTVLVQAATRSTRMTGSYDA